jgi:hypothetical protein
MVSSARQWPPKARPSGSSRSTWGLKLKATPNRIPASLSFLWPLSPITAPALYSLIGFSDERLLMMICVALISFRRPIRWPPQFPRPMQVKP